MKKLLLFLIIILSQLSLFAQRSADNWYFGVNATLRFPGASVVSGSVLNTTEGCSSISNSSGALQFYTNGVSVWNRNNALMPNGTGLLGGISSTQSALIVPLPGNPNVYYIFTVAEDGGANGFRYSIVDMTLNANNGDVTTSKNILILNNVTEKLTAVQKPGSSDYWVMVHEWGTDAYYCYTLDATGLVTTPVISNIGIVHSNAQIQNTYGQIKFNTCGTQLAAAMGYLNTIEIFDFDATSGVLTSPITLPMSDHVYGIEFSPNGNLLYASCYDPSATLIQFDLTSHNSATVFSTLTPLSTTTDIYGIQMANNGKIYVCRSWNSYLGEIDNPDVAGTGCNYIDNGVNLDPNSIGITSGLGLPGFVQSEFLPVEQLCTFTSMINPDFQFTAIFPNPSTDEFTIRNLPEATIFVYDQLGELIEEKMNSNTSDEINFGKDFLNGVYFIRIKSKNGTHTAKLIKI